MSGNVYSYALVYLNVKAHTRFCVFLLTQSTILF